MAQRSFLILPEQTLFIFIIPCGPYIVKIPEAAPIPWFPSRAKRLKNILNPVQNVQVVGAEPHKRHCLKRGNSVGKLMRFPRNPDTTLNSGAKILSTGDLVAS